MIKKKDILQTICAIEWEFGFQAGKWEENEHIFEQIAESEFNYITSMCDNCNFKYSINDDITNEILKKTAEEYEEEVLTIEQIKNVEINEDNYWQFDALASHIKDKLIEHLVAQL